MKTLEKFQSILDMLEAERNQIAADWVLHHCWLVQVKPGGTARTNSKYWQVRSRQPMFDGKMLKHLKPNEVEAYRAAIERGRQLKQLDRQIAKLHQEMQQLFPPANSAGGSSEGPFANPSANPSAGPIQHEALLLPAMLPSIQESIKEPIKQPVKQPYPSLSQCTNLAEQERLVETVLAHSRALRASLRQSLTLSKQLGARNIDLRSRHLN